MWGLDGFCDTSPIGGPSEEQFWSWSTGSSGQLAGFTEVVVVWQTDWVSVWKTIEGSWFVLGRVSLNHHGINVPVTFL